MPRICNRCGRKLTPEEHDVLRYPDDYKDKAKRGTIQKVTVGMRRGRGRLGFQKVRLYGCRVRLIATSPVTGKTLAPAHPQRLAAAGYARYVHVSSFDHELKP